MLSAVQRAPEDVWLSPHGCLVVARPAWCGLWAQAPTLSSSFPVAMNPPFSCAALPGAPPRPSLVCSLCTNITNSRFH